MHYRIGPNCDKRIRMNKRWIPLTYKTDFSVNEISRVGFAWFFCLLNVRCLILAFEIAQLNVTSANTESRAIPLTNENESGMENHWLTAAAKYIDLNGEINRWSNSKIQINISLRAKSKVSKNESDRLTKWYEQRTGLDSEMGKGKICNSPCSSSSEICEE